MRVHKCRGTRQEITVGGYIDTVLVRHFEENKDEINELYRRDRDNLI